MPGSSQFNTDHPMIRRIVCVSLLLLCVPSCSDSGVRYPVRPDVARETLVSALTQWKNGARPEALSTADPVIIVQDVDWTGGAKLDQFELADDGQVQDANLSVSVRLTIVHPDGRKEARDVWYLVSTDPVRTVFRDLFHP